MSIGAHERITCFPRFLATFWLVFIPGPHSTAYFYEIGVVKALVYFTFLTAVVMASVAFLPSPRPLCTLIRVVAIQSQSRSALSLARIRENERGNSSVFGRRVFTAGWVESDAGKCDEALEEPVELSLAQPVTAIQVEVVARQVVVSKR
jgi:hypothetical protein